MRKAAKQGKTILGLAFIGAVILALMAETRKAALLAVRETTADAAVESVQSAEPVLRAEPVQRVPAVEPAQRVKPSEPVERAQGVGPAIKIGDKIRFAVQGYVDLSGEFEIDELGMLTLPLIGAVPAVGMTITEAKSTIIDKLMPDYLKGPDIRLVLIDPPTARDPGGTDTVVASGPGRQAKDDASQPVPGGIAPEPVAIEVAAGPVPEKMVPEAMIKKTAPQTPQTKTKTAASEPAPEAPSNSDSDLTAPNLKQQAKAEPAQTPRDSTIAVLDLVLARDVVDRNPVGKTAAFSSGDAQAFAFARLRNDGPSVRVSFVWYQGDAVISEFETKVDTSASWRTWSKVKIRPGRWRVELVTEGGQVLGDAVFSVQ